MATAPTSRPASQRPPGASTCGRDRARKPRATKPAYAARPAAARARSIGIGPDRHARPFPLAPDAQRHHPQPERQRQAGHQGGLRQHDRSRAGIASVRS